MGPYLDGELLAFQVMILGMGGGRKLSPDAPDLTKGSGANEFGLLLKAGGDFFVSRELTGYETFMGRSMKIARLPRGERETAQTVMEADLEASWYLVAKIAIPNLLGAQTNIDESNTLLDIARVLAAAQQHRLQHGAFPTQLSALKLGALPDPYDPKRGSLRYAVVNGEVRCYSVYENGVDDGGSHRAEKIRKDDLVLVTRAGKE
jgi:hypothetical protein